MVWASAAQNIFSGLSTFPPEISLQMWIQRTLRLPPARRGFHLITPEITKAVPELASIQIGWMQVFIQHTSASLTINENADPDVRVDFETAMNHAVPESLPYIHTIEGPDDMPAHVKASMMGASRDDSNRSWTPSTRHLARHLLVRASRPGRRP